MLCSENQNRAKVKAGSMRIVKIAEANPRSSGICVSFVCYIVGGALNPRSNAYEACDLSLSCIP